jgi:molybdopterin molybdotransferase
MIPLEEARAHVLERVSGLGPVTVAADDAVGLVLAQPVVSTEHVPPFANSAMDGFAVRSADTAPGATLSLVGTIAAGTVLDGEIGRGQTARIMTGAPMPAGADAVVMVERASVDGDLVTIEVEVPSGNHVRPSGDDMEPGDRVLEPGVAITPAVLGLLRTLGIDSVDVTRPPKIGVMSTGDELVEQGLPLAPGQIRDSNRATLLALTAAVGAEAIDLGLIRDDEAAIQAILAKGATTCDAILSSGGVSMGDFDYVKTVLDRVGDMRWMQVAIKPAKPLAFGVIDAGHGKVPVFGLPGNPVSSVVSFELFARPGIRKMMGFAELDRRRIRATATAEFRRRDDDKIHFARGVLSSDSRGFPMISPLTGQGSHQIAALAQADALAVLPPKAATAKGDFVDVIPLT